jgi:hypothetical protein
MKIQNLGLFGFCMVGMFGGIPGEAALFSTSPQRAILLVGLMTFTRLVGAITSSWGWLLGIRNKTNKKGTNKRIFQIVNELWNGTKQNIKSITRRENWKSVRWYQVSWAILAFCLFSNFAEGWRHMRYNSVLKKSTVDISVRFSATARLFLISSLIHSVKVLSLSDDTNSDPNDTSNAKHSLQLNGLIGLWALSVGIAQNTTMTGFLIQNVYMLLFASKFFVKAYKDLLIIQQKDRMNSNNVEFNDVAGEEDQERR